MAQLVGVGIEVGKFAIDKLESRKGGSSARSVGIRLRNRTSSQLALGHCEVSHGIWTEGVAVPNEIPANGWGTWMAESHGAATGTEGYVKYEIGDSGETLRINFNNPFIGSNSNSVNVEGGSTYKASYEGGSGNNCYITVKLEGGPAATEENSEENGEENNEGGDDEGGDNDKGDNDEEDE